MKESEKVRRSGSEPELEPGMPEKRQAVQRTRIRSVVARFSRAIRFPKTMTVVSTACAVAAFASPSVMAAPGIGSVGAERLQVAASALPTAASSQGVIYGPACPDVMVIAARGTGEAPLGSDWTSPSAYTTDSSHGAGATLAAFYAELLDSRQDLTFSLESVVYPVPSLKDLKTLLNFESDARTGATSIVADIKQTDMACGNTVRYVLAGYSEGAWAVHDALNDLKGSLAEVLGVALFGDPKFQPNQPVVRDFASQDINSGMAAGVDKKDNSIPPTLVSKTGSWCFPDDPVCQVLSDKLDWSVELADCINGSACSHFLYAPSETKLAVSFLGPFLPKQGRGTWAMVSTRGADTCAIRTNHTLWCWGGNFDGELGIGNTTSQSAPVQVGTASNWAMVSMGAYFACATQNNGTLWCWGENGWGNLGTGDTTSHLTPVQVGSATSWARVSASQDSTCAISTDGALWCWGWNGLGGLGTGDTSVRLSPTLISPEGLWSKVSRLGDLDGCAIGLNGTLWCWGYNGQGELGLGNTTSHLTPVQVGTNATWATVSSALGDTCATRTDGTLWCWGDNSFGQLGIGDTTTHLSPVQVGSVTTWTAVTEGSSAACGLRNGTLWCWGWNVGDQLGTGNSGNQSRPVQVGTATNWAKISSSSDENGCAIRTDGTLWCWGNNDGTYYPTPTKIS